MNAAKKGVLKQPPIPSRHWSERNSAEWPGRSCILQMQLVSRRGTYMVTPAAAGP